MADTSSDPVNKKETTVGGKNAPWVERHRPKSLKDVAHQSEVVATLQNAVATGRLPHLLFYGPPGSGKTSAALALCRQLWHPSQWKRRVLELNASDERGISVVRDKIKHFASLSVSNAAVAPSSTSAFSLKSGASSTAKRLKVGSKQSSAASFFAAKPKAGKEDEESAPMDVDEDTAETATKTANTNEDKYPNPPFKIIILDEADTVTPDAQAALRRIIEAHSKITRFILICNYVTRIIEPLASRCAKFRFQPLPPASMKQRLTDIANAEGCAQPVCDLMDEVLEHADGDMRRAVMTMQSLHALSIGGAPLDRDMVAEIVGLPPPTVVKDVYKALQAQEFSKMQDTVDDVCAQGYSAQAILSGFLPLLMEDQLLTEISKGDIAIRIAEAEKNMNEGADEYLQLVTVCSLAYFCFEAARNSKSEA